MTKEPVTFFVFQKHSVFIPLRFVYPECFHLIEKQDQLYPLHCLRNDQCPVNASCMDILVKRIDYLFTQVVPNAQQIIAYFKYKDRPKSIRAGVFTRDLAEPKLMTLNISGFHKFQKEGVIYTWIPSDEFMLMSPNYNTVIPVTNLIKKL